MIIKEITIDLWQKYTKPIEINQYEAEGRGLKINITAGSLPVNLTGVNVSLHAKKPDGHVTHNACTAIDAVNGKVLYTISGQTCIKDGELECCLVLINSGPAELRSQTFIITVKPSPDISSSVESTSEFTALTEALAMVAGLTPSGSLVQDEDGLHLVGDEVLPANGKFYGVFGGARGFYDLTLGWIPADEEWTFVSPTQIAVSGDKRNKYEKCNPIKWTQNGTVRQSHVISAVYDSGANKTTITKHAGHISTPGDCDFLNTASYPITDNYYSKAANPQGFVGTFFFSATCVPESGTFTSVRHLATYFTVVGGLCYMPYNFDGTCSGTPLYIDMSLPVPVAPTPNGIELFFPATVNLVPGRADIGEALKARIFKIGGTWNTGTFSKGNGILIYRI
jgi:archaellin